MILSHIDLGKLSVSSTNMRGGRKAPDMAGILLSVRARGVLVPTAPSQPDPGSPTPLARAAPEPEPSGTAAALPLAA